MTKSEFYCTPVAVEKGLFEKGPDLVPARSSDSAFVGHATDYVMQAHFNPYFPNTAEYSSWLLNSPFTVIKHRGNVAR